MLGRADEHLDCMGEPCPIPIIKTAKLVPTLQIDSVLEVLSDDPGILPDMEAWCKSHAQEYLGSTEEEIDARQAWRVYVRKKN